jgi:hypothetical protein
LAGFEPARENPTDFKSVALTTRPQCLLNKIASAFVKLQLNDLNTIIFFGFLSEVRTLVNHSTCLIKIKFTRKQADLTELY